LEAQTNKLIAAQTLDVRKKQIHHSLTFWNVCLCV
jgi:hypothetical protein